MSYTRLTRPCHVRQLVAGLDSSPVVSAAVAASSARSRRQCQANPSQPDPPRRVGVSARRGRGSSESPATHPDAATEPTASTSAPPVSGGGGGQGNQGSRQSAPRRRQFGPEPPPSPLTAATEQSNPGTSSDPATASAAADTGAAAAATAPKRRGRPAKSKEPVASPSSASSSVSAPSPARSKRKPFGPEPPPPPPAPTSPDPLPVLPADPSELTPEDILNLPLPEPGIPGSEPLRIRDLLAAGGDSNYGSGGDDTDGDADEDEDLLGGSGGASGGDEEDGDLDYDKLIQLAGRVDASAYVERAFDRARRGLDPTPDPMEGSEEGEDAGAAAAAAAAPASTSRPGGGGDAARSGPARPTQQPPSGAASPSSPAPGAAAGAADVPPRRTAVPASGSTASEPGKSYVDVELLDALTGGPAATSEEAAEAAGRRRVAVLVDLLGASGTELEEKLEAVAPEVDEQMLGLLERRYATAIQLGQDEAITERIGALYSALRYIYQRRTSSPAERLLDDVLDILADEQAQPNRERRQRDAAARLRNAFTGGMLDVDVFTAAAALADQRQAAADALAGEQVSLESFKAEAMGLLTHAKKVQQTTAESLQAVDAEVERLRREEPGVLAGQEWQLRLGQVAAAREALLERQGSIEALEEVLLITRAIEVQMLTGRMGKM